MDKLLPPCPPMLGRADSFFSKGYNLTPQALAGQLPWEGSLCWKEAQAHDTHRTSILESLCIQAVERVDYRLGSIYSQILAIFLPSEEAPLEGSCPLGTEGYEAAPQNTLPEFRQEL
jgi:hypothetical protein